MAVIAILLTLFVLTTAAESIKLRPASLDVDPDVLEMLSVEVEKVQQRSQVMIKELEQKYDDEIDAIKKQLVAMKSEIKDQNVAHETELDIIKKEVKLQSRHRTRLMPQGGITDGQDSDRRTSRNIGIPREATAYTNNTRFQQDSAVGIVAFQARNKGFTGGQGVHIPFEIVDLNIGGAYDPTGFFTAPVAGIYLLNYDIIADSACGENHAYAILNVHGVQLVTACSETMSSGGSSVVMKLALGDRVTLTMAGPCFNLNDDTEEKAANHFGGSLLYGEI